MGTIEKQLAREIMAKNKNYSVNDVYDKLKGDKGDRNLVPLLLFWYT